MGRNKKETYDEFVNKFKSKHTSDDCFTPDNIYNVVADWVASEYSLDKSKFTRPFWPGGDYQKEDYTDKVVVDNPPFSILSDIVRWYLDNGVKFFLFAPHLTLFSTAHDRFYDMTHIVCGTAITYQNGAKVPTSFLTNMGMNVAVMTVPDLAKKIKEADEANRYESKVTRNLPRYAYPKNLVRISDLCQVMKRSNDRIIIRIDECHEVTRLDDQKEYGKKLFGNAILVGDDIADEIESIKQQNIKHITTVWKLSPRERKIIDGLKQ